MNMVLCYSKMKEYLRLIKYIKPHLAIFIIAVVCMFFSAIFDGVSLSMIVPLADKVLTNKQIVIATRLPTFVMNFIDKINQIPPLKMLNIMAWSVLVLFIFKGLFHFLQGYLMSDVGQRVIRDVRLKLYQKLQDLSLDFYSQKRTGELISRITNDVKTIENAVSYGLTDFVYQSFQIILFTFLLFMIHWKMALIALLLFPLVVFPTIKIGRKLRKLTQRQQERMADINSLLAETISGVRIVKAFNMENYEISKFASQNRDNYKLEMKTIKRNLLLNPITEFIGALCGIIVFFFAGREVIAGRLSFGVFGLFLGSLLSLIRPFKKLSQVNALTQRALAANSRIYDILDTPATLQEKQGAVVLSRLKDNIRFENVWFRYETNTPYVLQDINLEVKYGQMVALVGPTGAGKSSLINLILRFYDPQRGRIIIDGIDIKDVTLKSLRQQIGMVTQEIILFNDTITANIAYGRPNEDIKLVEAAARKAFAHDFIKNMPQGYNTIIGDRGFKLSGGEKQRLAIARAILKNPTILILDEATSQLDSESERLVQEAINKLIEHRTVFCIAHRLSTVRRADKIVVLDKGKIVDFGTHEELLFKGGLYKKLHDTQFQM
jgi:subfamily B ATP-binding cassette protein MsbA